MKKNSPSAGRNRSSKVSMTLGRDRFAKISAVEGIALATDMRKRVVEFDRQGASAEERRRSIIRAHSKG